MEIGKFTIGTDQEMFAVREKDYISAIPLIKGTKEDPEPLPSGGSIQHDNVAVEFAIDPATSKVDLIQKIGNALQDVMNYLPYDVKIDVTPSAVFPDDQLKDPEASEIGCDPDFDAWDGGKKNEPPQGFAKQPMRTAGGHIHVGFVKGSRNNFLESKLGRIHIVKMFDLFHGVVFSVLDSSTEALRRRELYGKPGCYRLTNYGVEYRTLSNFWINSPELVALVYHLTNDVLGLIRDKKSISLLQSVSGERIQEIIQDGMHTEAMNLVKRKLLENMSSASSLLFDICFFNSMSGYDMKKEWDLK